MRTGLFIAFVVLLFTVACEPIEVGEPPTFNGPFTKEAINASQINLQWQPASDDKLDDYELSYAIWVAEEGDTLDTDAQPTYVTGEGALSFNLVDLDPQTSYQVLVRALDAGDNYSANTTADTIETLAAGSGRFEADDFSDLDFTGNDLLCGRVYNDARWDVGVIENDEIFFLESNANGNLNLRDDELEVGAQIEEAHLMATRDDVDRYDLFVLTTSNLRYYANNESDGFENPATPFSQLPVPGSLTFAVRNEVMEWLGFVNSSGTGYIYKHDGDGNFTLEDDYTFGQSNAVFRLARVDGDSQWDMVVFGSAGLSVRLGSDDDPLTFDGADDVDRDFARDDDLHQLIVRDLDGDGRAEIIVWIEDNVNHTKKIRVYRNNGQGSFADPEEIDLGIPTLENPRFVDFDGDDELDLLVSETGSNNAVIFTGVEGLKTADAFFGTDGFATDAVLGDFDGKNRTDMAILSRSASKVNVLISNPDESSAGN